MAIRSGFFNSINGDRKYSAERFAEYFASFIGNGVFPNPSDGLQVMANDDMTVTVKAGKAWINGYIFISDDDYILEVEPADGVLNRIDRVVARYDTVDREIRLEVKKGTFASKPTAPDLQRDADAYELALADVYVAAGSISISQADITDLRLNSELCGIVHGTVEQVDTTTLFNQYVDWYTTTTGQAETDIEAIKQQFQDNLTQFEQDWNDWFSQQQTEGFVMAVEKGQPNGIATLDENGKVPDEQLPEIEVPVTSVNGQTGDVVLDAADVGAETPTGAQEKADTAEANAKNYADLVAGEVEDELESHKNESTQNAHLAKNIGIEDTAGNFTATDVEGALAELFQSVSDGKNQLETAITDKGGTVSKQGSIATFDELDTGIRSIPQAKGNALPSDVLSGKTFSSENAGIEVVGTMPNQGQKIITPSTINIVIPRGFHDGTGYVEGSVNLKPENIKNGVNVFGVIGNLIPITPNAGTIPLFSKTGVVFSEDWNTVPTYKGYIKFSHAGTYEVRYATYGEDILYNEQHQYAVPVSQLYLNGSPLTERRENPSYSRRTWTSVHTVSAGDRIEFYLGKKENYGARYVVYIEDVQVLIDKTYPTVTLG